MLATGNDLKQMPLNLTPFKFQMSNLDLFENSRTIINSKTKLNYSTDR